MPKLPVFVVVSEAPAQVSPEFSSLDDAEAFVRGPASPPGFYCVVAYRRGDDDARDAAIARAQRLVASAAAGVVAGQPPRDAAQAAAGRFSAEWN